MSLSVISALGKFSTEKKTMVVQEEKVGQRIFLLLFSCPVKSWTTAHQAPLSFSISWSLPRFYVYCFGTLDTQVHAALPPKLIRTSHSEKTVAPLLVHWSLKTRNPKCPNRSYRTQWNETLAVPLTEVSFSLRGQELLTLLNPESTTLQDFPSPLKC